VIVSFCDCSAKGNARLLGLSSNPDDIGVLTATKWNAVLVPTSPRKRRSSTFEA
jgi:hypothetical protein